MINIFLVGGAVRDNLMGRLSHDFDFSVEADSYDAMKEWLFENNFEIFLETPQHFTIRARRLVPWAFAGFNLSGQTFDFVLCRKDGAYSDGRRPDTVEIGTLFDDLARRDFTVNAMALDADGNLIDPHNGLADLEAGTLRCVGGTERLDEDALRIFRAIRFTVVLGFTMDDDILDHIEGNLDKSVLARAHENRIREELTKAFSFDTLETLRQLDRFTELSEYIFKETDIRLLPTTKGF